MKRNLKTKVNNTVNICYHYDTLSHLDYDEALLCIASIYDPLFRSYWGNDRAKITLYHTDTTAIIGIHQFIDPMTYAPTLRFIDFDTCGDEYYNSRRRIDTNAHNVIDEVHAGVFFETVESIHRGLQHTLPDTLATQANHYAALLLQLLVDTRLQHAQRMYYISLWINQTLPLAEHIDTALKDENDHVLTGYYHALNMS